MYIVFYFLKKKNNSYDFIKLGICFICMIFVYDIKFCFNKFYL